MTSAIRISSPEQRLEAIAKAAALMNSDPDSPEGREFETLVDAIADYDMLVLKLGDQQPVPESQDRTIA